VQVFWVYLGAHNNDSGEYEDYCLCIYDATLQGTISQNLYSSVLTKTVEEDRARKQDERRERNEEQRA
jgi:hypothetical protein